MAIRQQASGPAGGRSGPVRSAGLAVVVGVSFGACGEEVDELAAPAAPTYASDVAPIVFQHCAGCHRPDGVAPFSVLDYASIQPFARLIADNTAAGVMPPWLPAEGYARFAEDRRLSGLEIETLRRWAETGAPEGDPAALPEPPADITGWHLGTPDLAVEMAEPFPLSADVYELFRNVVIPVPLDGRRWVRGIELHPSDPRVVHHATLMVDVTPSSRQLDARDPGEGFDGMISSGEARNPGGFLLGWTPGKVPSLAPPGLAWPMDPGDDIVVQLHLRPRGEPGEDISVRIGLYFAEAEPERMPFVIRLGSRTVDLSPGVTDYLVDDTYTLPVDVEALGVYPHAHYLGRSMKVWATLPDADTTWLLRIEDWNFNWQDTYRYEEPVDLPRGSVLHLRYTFDNSAANPLNPHDPPRRVLYGPRSEDEMAELWLQVLPRSVEERAELELDFARKDLRDRVEGWDFALRRDPDDMPALAGLGSVAQARGEADLAEAYFRRALSAAPDFVPVRYNLALLHQSLGRPDSAHAEYRRVVELAPGHADAQNNLGNLLAGAGRFEEAVARYEAAITADPSHSLAHNNLGNALRSLGRLGGAEIAFRDALALDPDYAEAHFNLGMTLRLEGKLRESLAEYGEAYRLAPNWPAPYGAAAWILATDPDPDVRDAEEAIRLARRAVTLTRSQPAALNVLAAALASAGDFDQAIRTAERSIAEARGRSDAGSAALARRLLAEFRAGRPIIEERADAGWPR